jgi:hypothetical protein
VEAEAWVRSRFAMSGAEYAVQEALTALQRVLDQARVSARTRARLIHAIASLHAEQRRSPTTDHSPTSGTSRPGVAAPK